MRLIYCTKVRVDVLDSKKLCNKTRRSPQGKRTTGKNNRVFSKEKEMLCRVKNRAEFERIKFKRKVIAEGKFTNKTVVKIVMAVCEFGLGEIVFVVTMFFRKLLYQMLIRVHRLKQYCEQYANQERQAYILQFFSHSLQR